VRTGQFGFTGDLILKTDNEWAVAMMNRKQLEGLVSDGGALIDRRIYTDEEVYRLEQEQIFGKCWLFVGHESQIKEPGDFVTSYMGEESVIVSRSKEGRVHVSLNSCRHRGLKVCRADKGKANSFSCPYHGWTYGSDGSLTGMPQKERYYPNLIKSDWGLQQARVDIYKGLIFATFDDDADSLDAYLGDSAFYLDALVDRRGQGTEVIGVQKWIVKTNWKMPTENMVGDVYHAGVSHRSVFDMHPDAKAAYAEIEDSLNVSMTGGHGLTVRLLDEDTPIEGRLPCETQMAMMEPKILDYYRQHDAATREHLGPVKSRIKSGTSGIFPNFCMLSTTFCIRVAHPRGPNESEIWNWIIVEKDMPREVKEAIKGNYYFAFGPEGLLEQDDDENWEQVTAGTRGNQARKAPFHLGMGVGLEGEHPDLPGKVGPTNSEHPQRELYTHWHKMLLADESDTYGGC